MLRKNTWRTWLTLSSKSLIFGVLLVTVFSPIGAAFQISNVQAAGECKPQTPSGGEAPFGTPVDPVDGKCPFGYFDPTGSLQTSPSKPPESPESFGDGSLGRWLANIIYIFTVGLGTAVAYVGAWVFSLATAFTLSSTAYALTFLSEGWEIVRDIANMFFILILVYIAFTVMFRADTAETMKRLAWVIAIALVINFSFFFVRVVIDAGNLLAVQFYNAIDAPPIGDTIANSGLTGDLTSLAAGGSTVTGTGKNTKDLTAAIMGGIGAQTILNTESFEKFADQNNWFTELLALTFVYIALGAILFILAAAFFTIGIKFIVRTGVLWLVLIAAPLALIANTVRQGEEMYQKWQEALIMHAFYPAVFLFIFYILTLFMEQLAPGGTTIVESTFSELNSVQTSGLLYTVPLVAVIAIKLGFVIALLYLGLQAADQMGVQGAKFASWASNKIPLMGGLKSYGRLGGVAFQRSIGWGASAADRGLAKTRLGNAPLIGRLLRTPAGALAGAKFGGARSYKEVLESNQKWKKERAANNWAIQNRGDLKRLGELEEKDKKGQLIDPDEIAEHKRLSDRVGRFGKSDFEGHKVADLERIVRVLKEGQVKGIKELAESGKFKSIDAEEIENAWHEHSNDAPLKKANKQIELLRQIDTSLRTIISHPLRTHTSPGATINTANMQAMSADITDKIAEVNQNIDATRRANGNTKSLHQDLHNLRQALNKLEKLDEERKKVPTKVGGIQNQGEFTVS